MMTCRARLTRLLIKHVVGRKFSRAGHSVTELRKLDEFLIGSQRPQQGWRWILEFGPGCGTYSKRRRELYPRPEILSKNLADFCGKTFDNEFLGVAPSPEL